jgi:hypothetical protein
MFGMKIPGIYCKEIWVFSLILHKSLGWEGGEVQGKHVGADQHEGDGQKVVYLM